MASRKSNLGSSDEYADLFMSLIADWRDKWQKPQMPFYFVQLSNHGKKEEIQDDSDWAAIREAQAQALHLNHTGMVVTTDIGKEKQYLPKHSGNRSSPITASIKTNLRKKKNASISGLQKLQHRRKYPSYPFENLGKDSCIPIQYADL